MSNYKQLDQGVWASPQIALTDMLHLREVGVRQVINNRPDGEDPEQPNSAEMQQAANDAGLRYLHIPIAGFPDADAVAAVSAALEADEPTLMFCRSGTRSTVVWALAMRSLGRAEPDALRASAAAAGYDISRLPL